MSRTRRPPLFAAPIAAAVAAVFGLGGCTSKPATVATTSAARAENPWPKVDAQLRKDGSLASCRGVLAQLNSELALNTDPQYQPAGLAPDAEAALQKAANLTEAEVKELRPNSFTNLDPNYLAECLYLRDVAQSLDAAGLPPAKRAELAFAWVCRQLVLSHWVTPVSQSEARPMEPVPPTYALRRGSGSGLERAFVLLALFQQLGIDGCLVGPPEAETRGWAFSTDPAKPPKGPFWAVGARVGADVLLFDPWRGEQLPGTLAQLKTNPDPLKPWFEDKARPWDVTPDAVKAATPFVAAPLSGLAPRMQRLEKELQATGAPRLAADPVALKGRFAAEAKLPEVKVWNPANDPYTVTRGLGSFLPPAEGGSAPDERLYNAYQQSAVPADVLNMYRVDQVPIQVAERMVPARLRGPFAPLLPSRNDLGVAEAVKRVALASIGVFQQAFLMNPTPRERVQRGQFAEVTPTLVATQKRFADARQRVQGDRSRVQGLEDWAGKAREVYSKLADARASRNAVAVAEAEAAVEFFWKSEQVVATALIDLTIADAGMAEATYLLASCLHERAERTQARYDRVAADPRQQAALAEVKRKAAEDWEEAEAGWKRYKEHAAGQAEAFPGRAEHVDRLAGRAALQFSRLRGR